MKKIIIFLFFALLMMASQAQPVFMDKVEIEFVKTFSYEALVKQSDIRWYDIIKDRMMKEVLSYFSFTGDGSKSLYKRIKEPEIRPGLSYGTLADNNVVYNDYLAQTTVSQKPVYEENYLIQDSLLKIKWKLTADTRMIAGFECRKAVGILYDSIAVFAFYTDEIMINGGPEGINGLPGMILGVGIPRLHTTWFATKVKLIDAGELKKVTPVSKGKKISRINMIKEVSPILRRWQGGIELVAYII
jgi:GLPGLI family protein